jgi:hypothetical protein
MTGILIALDLGQDAVSASAVADLLSDWRFLLAMVALESATLIGVCRWVWKRWSAWRERRQRNRRIQGEDRRTDREP